MTQKRWGGVDRDKSECEWMATKNGAVHRNHQNWSSRRKNIQIDVLKKFLVSMNKIWWITKDKGGAGNFGISEKSKNFQQ